MQKFLRIRTPPCSSSSSSSPPISSALLLSSSSLSPPKPLFKPISLSSSFVSCLKPRKSLIMPTTYGTSAALHPPCIGYLPAKKTSTSSAAKTTYLSRRVAAAAIACRSPAEAQRPWAVLKDLSNGSRLAWLHTAVGGGNGDKGLDEVSEAEVESESEMEGEEEGEVEESGGVNSGSGAAAEEKRVRLQRRRSGGGSAAVAGNPDLLTIPGVGPRNLRKLVDKGIGGVAELKQLYRDKFFGKSSQNMVEYLQSSVGIIHRNHAESITGFIKKRVDEEVKEDWSSSGVKSQRNRVTLCVEGNISVGKTTFLKRIAGETLELQDLVEIVPEPVDKWQDIGADHFNILDAFYAEPKRYAYTFQNYVFVTRVMQERDSSGGIEPLRLMERSVFSDRMVFVRAVHEAKWMSEMEINIYDSWFDPVVSCLPGLIPDGFIYLRASPDTCHKRMMHRKRAEEGGVSLDYLRDLHEKHESWFLPSESENHLLSVSKPPFQIGSLHPDIRDRVYFLEGAQMHSSLQKVPTLILDCDPDIDFNRDVEAKRHYARQVAEFFKFVKKGKEVQPLRPGEGAGKDGYPPQVILPQNGGLWVPDGKHFPDAALQSLDFRRAMSAV